jgi:hypothetical protein
MTAMTTSPTSADSQPMSRSEWGSTLPPWRRLLAMLNWRPVDDIEQDHRHSAGELTLREEFSRETILPAAWQVVA